MTATDTSGSKGGTNPILTTSAAIWHLIFTLMGIGYGFEYYFHLRHHKNNAH